MKLNELIGDFSIFTTNEEQKFLDKFSKGCYTDTLTEREQILVDNLVRKSILTKVKYQGSIWVSIDENYKPSS
jgi:pyoverdine/dityrosine biosynthesis protein Dit1